MGGVSPGEGEGPGKPKARHGPAEALGNRLYHPPWLGLPWLVDLAPLCMKAILGWEQLFPVSSRGWGLGPGCRGHVSSRGWGLGAESRGAGP